VTITNGYTTVAEVRDHLGDSGSKLDVDLLERAISTASRAVDNYCGGGKPRWRRFWTDTVATARVFQVDDVGFAWVDDFWDLATLAVATDDDDDGVFETTWVQNTDYRALPLNAGADTGSAYAYYQLAAVRESINLVTPQRFRPYQRRPVLQVTAKWGWSAVPPEVNLATIILAVKLFKRKDAPFGVAGMSDFGAVRIAQSDPDVKMLLAAYVKLRSRGMVFQVQRDSIFHQRWT
jgi:hypothetical protein